MIIYTNIHKFIHKIYVHAGIFSVVFLFLFLFVDVVVAYLMNETKIQLTEDLRLHEQYEKCLHFSSFFFFFSR